MGAGASLSGTASELSSEAAAAWKTLPEHVQKELLSKYKSTEPPPATGAGASPDTAQELSSEAAAALKALPEHVQKELLSKYKSLSVSLPAWPKPKPPAHGGNTKVPPTQWSMTISQFNHFVDFCKATPEWQKLKDTEVKFDGKVVKPKGFVSGYQLCDNFVKPWTAGTGCGVALMCTRASRITLPSHDLACLHGAALRCSNSTDPTD